MRRPIMEPSAHAIELTPLAVALIRAARFADEPTQAECDRVRLTLAARIAMAVREVKRRRRLEWCRQN
jgi:hypothetical protein